MIYVAIFFAALLAMEGVAWLTHRYLMHGPLWSLHRSHHRRREGRFERNDWFGVIFAAPSIVLIALGMEGRPALLAIGLGMTAYGVVYFLVHDVLVHRRVQHAFVPSRGYLNRIVRAHLMHHRTTTKEGAVSFGFVFCDRPEKLRERLEANRRRLQDLPASRLQVREAQAGYPRADQQCEGQRQVG